MIDRLRAGLALVLLGVTLILVSLLAARPARPARRAHPALGPAPAAVGPGNTAAAAQVRLRVLANSDSAADQALKVRVRDALVAVLAPAVQEAPDAAALQARLAARLGLLARSAQAAVRQAGYAYPVRVELGDFPMDARSLGRTALPAGEYPTLRVLIGAAAGHNWWCLLFPPLCFAGGPLPPPLLADPAPGGGGAAATGGDGTAAADRGDGTVLTPGPAEGSPALLDDSAMAPEARSALLEWLRQHGVRAERLGRWLRLWLG